MKRMDYIGWDSFFIGIAALASFRSKDPDTQNGACIVDPTTKRIISVGYNGFPRGCSDDEFPWDRKADHPADVKYSYVLHAEANAILNSFESVKGCSLYLYSEKGYYPCCNCAQAIVQKEIAEVVIAFAKDEATDKYDWTATKRMFTASGVNIRIMNYPALAFSDLSRKFGNIAERITEDYGKQD